MPSWQARMMNTCTRVMMKPMMRFGSVESMRNMTATFGAFSVIAGISSMIVIPSIVDHFGISSNLAISKHCDSLRAARI
jgi:hypothetical protein